MAPVGTPWEANLRHYGIVNQPDKRHRLIVDHKLAMTSLLKQIDETYADLGVLQDSISRWSNSYKKLSQKKSPTEDAATAEERRLKKLLLNAKFQKAKKREAQLLHVRAGLEHELSEVVDVLARLQAVGAGDKLGGTPTVRSKGADINIDAMWAAHRERGGYVRRYDPLLEATQAAAAATAAAGRGDGGVEARNGAGAGGEAFDLDVRPAWPPSPLPPPAADRARMMIGQSQDLTGFSTVNGDHSWPSSPTYPHPQQPRQQAPHPPGLQSHPHSQQHEAAAITPSSGPEQPRRAPPRTHSAGEERGGGGVRAVHKTVAFEQARPAPSRPQAVGLWAGATPDAPPTLLRQVSGPARGGSAPDPVAQQTQALAEKARAAAARYYERHGGTTSPTRYMPASRATASPASPAPADVPLTRYHADTGLTYSPYRSSPSRAGPYSPGGVLYGPPPPAPSPPPALTPVQGADPVGTTSWNAERWEVLEGQLLAELAATRHANKAAAKAVRLGGNDLPRHDYMQSGHRGGGSGSGGRGDNSGAQRELMELRREVDGLRQALHAERMNSLRVLERAGRDKADVLHRLAGEVGELVRLDNPILGVRWSE